jgi:2'-5' RNA ligase
MRYIFKRVAPNPDRLEGRRLMQGVVSLLDEQHYARVGALWEELGQKFDVRGMYGVHYPHFSYQIADRYDDEACERFLKDVAARTRPFRVRTSGLAVFTVASPILHIPVVRSPQLSALHREIWEGVTAAVPGQVAHYYHPDEWVPHITLAHGDVDQEKLSDIMRVLCGRNFHWELTVNNLAIIYDTGKEQGVRCRFNFNGGGQ